LRLWQLRGLPTGKPQIKSWRITRAIRACWTSGAGKHLFVGGWKAWGSSRTFAAQSRDSRLVVSNLAFFSSTCQTGTDERHCKLIA